MRNAIWFAKKDPTMKEFNQAKYMGYDLRGISSGVDAFALKDERKALRELKNVSELFDATALFGTITVPIMVEMRITAEYAVRNGGWDKDFSLCYAGSNDQDSWYYVGKLCFWLYE